LRRYQNAAHLFEQRRSTIVGEAHRESINSAIAEADTRGGSYAIIVLPQWKGFPNEVLLKIALSNDEATALAREAEIGFFLFAVGAPILRPIDYGVFTTDDGRQAEVYVTEHLPTLSEDSIKSPEELLRASCQLATALALLHSNGIVHHNLNIGNLRLKSKRVKLSGFGCATMHPPLAPSMCRHLAFDEPCGPHLDALHYSRTMNDICQLVGLEAPAPLRAVCSALALLPWHIRPSMDLVASKLETALFAL
jgi:serine/threonine protein kinase